jgi:hypothetical protein
VSKRQAAPVTETRPVRTRAQQRKDERRRQQEERHAANVAAGTQPKVRKRKADNMKYCDRCAIGGPRLIVCGQVCICRSIRADRDSVRSR